MSTVSPGGGVGGWIRQLFISGREAFRDVREHLLHERLVRVMAILGGIVLVLAVTVWVVERNTPDSTINSFGKALYWVFISGTTTGYGDITPETVPGRFLTVIVILLSMFLTAVITAAIASYFVEKRLMEGWGMEKLNSKNHIVICGWNINGRRVLDGIYRDTGRAAEVVLINNLCEEDISDILYSYRREGLRFVRGDFVHESNLDKANVSHARSVIILADGELCQGYVGADERTILCALAVKSLNPETKVCAELVDRDNIGHLKRAHVDHVVILGEHNDFFLSSSVSAPGVTLAVKELLSREEGPLIQQARIPLQLVDQSFRELVDYFRDKKRAIVIGLVKETVRGMTLDDILSDDMTAVDRFIKAQFEGMEGDYFSKVPSMSVKINPPDDHKVARNDRALLIVADGQVAEQ